MKQLHRTSLAAISEFNVRQRLNSLVSSVVQYNPTRQVTFRNDIEYSKTPKARTSQLKPPKVVVVFAGFEVHLKSWIAVDGHGLFLAMPLCLVLPCRRFPLPSLPSPLGLVFGRPFGSLRLPSKGGSTYVPFAARPRNGRGVCYEASGGMGNVPKIWKARKRATGVCVCVHLFWRAHWGEVGWAGVGLGGLFEVFPSL